MGIIFPENPRKSNPTLVLMINEYHIRVIFMAFLQFNPLLLPPTSSLGIDIHGCKMPFHLCKNSNG